MKWFNNWIKKQFAKRFPDEFRMITHPEIPAICLETRRVEIVNFTKAISVNKELELMIPAERIAKELALKFIPDIIENMEIIRKDDLLMHQFVYEGRIKMIPAEKGVICDWRKNHE